MNTFLDYEDVTPSDSDVKAAKKESETIETLTEPIKKSILRDLNNIYSKVLFYFNQSKHNKDEIYKEIANYDLWGPFIFILLFSFCATMHSVNSKENTFSTILLYLIFGVIVLGVNFSFMKIKLTPSQG